MRTVPLADARILAPVVAFLEDNGAHSESYLDRLRIPGEMIEAGGMIAKKQIHDMFLEVATRQRCEEIGFAAYLRFQLADLGPTATAMRSAKTAIEALDIFCRLASRAYEGNEYYLKSAGETTWFGFRDRDHDSPGYVFSHHVTMMAYRRMVNQLVDETWRPRSMRCLGPNLQSHRNVDGFEECTVAHDKEVSALAIPTELISRSLPERGNSATDVGVSIPQGNQSNGQDTFVGSLQRLLASRFLYRKFPTLDQVAVIIGISPRTIQRCLQEEGLSYRRLLDRICIDAAHEMLATRQITIREIALELGYSGTNNFVRGFRRMTGTTPEEYRRRH